MTENNEQKGLWIIMDCLSYAIKDAKYKIIFNT